MDVSARVWWMRCGMTGKDDAGWWSGRWLWRPPNFAAALYEAVCAWASSGARDGGLTFASAVAVAGADAGGSADAGEAGRRRTKSGSKDRRV